MAITGDLHNKGKPPPSEYSDLYKLFDIIPDDVPVLIIGGNHDEVTPTGSPLQPLIGRRKNIKVSLTLETFEFKGMFFILAPWGTKYTELLALCNRYKGVPKMLLYHVGIIDDQFHWGEVEGEYGTVTVQQIADLDCSITMLGHYHGQVLFDTIHAGYASCPEYLSFGEQAQVKGFLIWDTNTRTATRMPTNPNKFITYTPEQFMNISDRVDSYIRIKGPVNEVLRLQVLDKMKTFKSLGLKPELQMMYHTRKVSKLQGDSNMEKLRNYLTTKKITTEIEECLKIDRQISQEVS